MGGVVSDCEWKGDLGDLGCGFVRVVRRFRAFGRGGNLLGKEPAPVCCPPGQRGSVLRKEARWGGGDRCGLRMGNGLWQRIRLEPAIQDLGYTFVSLYATPSFLRCTIYLFVYTCIILYL